MCKLCLYMAEVDRPWKGRHLVTGTGRVSQWHWQAKMPVKTVALFLGGYFVCVYISHLHMDKLYGILFVSYSHGCLS